MNDFDVAPLFAQIFCDQPTMAMFWRVSKQASVLKDFSRYFALDFPLTHQFQKLPFIELPVAILFLVAIEHLLSRGKQRQVKIVDAADGFEKITEIVFLRESGKLRNVVEAHIHEALGARILEASKKLLGGFLGKADGKNLHRPLARDRRSWSCSFAGVRL
jgi:hypothetical protein